MSALYPWQQAQWASLERAREQGTLAHALLFVAPRGTGLHEFADRWMQRLVCRATTAHPPCGTCPACQQYAAGTHPDAVRIVPEEAGKAIGIDAVRALGERLVLTGSGPNKVASIAPAEDLTRNAANSLLKTLEEPRPGVVILLLAHHAGRLPATIRSRCRQIAFGLPPRDTAVSWLHEQHIEAADMWLARSGGAPLLARELARDPPDDDALVNGLLDALESGRVPEKALEQAAALPLADSIGTLITAVEDLVRIGVGGAEPARLRRPEHAERMREVAGRLDARSVFDYLDELKRSVPGPSSALRPEFQIPGLLADATALCGNRRATGGGS